MYKPHFTTFAAYNQWANELVYDLAARLAPEEYHAERGAFFGSVHGTLNHILVADRIWLHRMSGDGPDYKILDKPLAESLDDLRALRRAEDDRIIAFIGSFGDDDFEKPFQYVTTEGDTWEQRYCDVLPHFFNHQTHHRGQTSTLLTQSGLPAPEMDLAYYMRAKLKPAA